MKDRTIRQLGIGFVIGFVVMSIGGVTWAKPSHDSAPGDAILEILSASVEVQAPDADTWQVVAGRTLVQEGTSIQTDSEGSALLVWFEDGTMVELGPDTQITITTFQTSADSFEIEFNLLQGRILNAVNKLRNPQSRYEIVTPSVQLAVRGTQFAVEVDAENMTTLVVHEGIVAAQQGEAVVDVPAGYYWQADSASVTPLASADEAVQELDRAVQHFVEVQLPDAPSDVPPLPVNPDANLPADTDTPPVINPAPVIENVTAPVTTIVEQTTTTTGNLVGQTVETTTQVTEAVTTVIDSVPIVGESGLDVGQTVEQVTTTTTEAVTTTVDETTTAVNETTTAVTESLNQTTTEVTESLNQTTTEVTESLNHLLTLPGWR